MSDQQLREAFTLMKAGKKQEAVHIVREVLKTDGKNDRAWWMMVHLLDDEEKKRKAAERVLQLNPTHGGALNFLQPAQPSAVDDKKKKRGQHDWSRIDQAQKRPDYTLHLYVAVILIVCVCFGSLALVALPTYLSTYIFNQDANGAKPENIALKAHIALELGDFNSLRAVTCPDLHETIAIWESEWDGPAWTLDTMTIDTSKLEFSYIDGNDFIDTASLYTDMNYPHHLFISLNGEAVTAGNGITVTYNFEEMAIAEGVDSIGFHVYRTESGGWFVCDGPEQYWDFE